MTISEHRCLRISIATISLFLVGAVCADRAMAQNATITLSANVQLTKLHPDVKSVFLRCSAPLANGQSRTDDSSLASVANRAVSKTLQAFITLYQSDLADPANRTVNVTCRIRLSNTSNGSPDTLARPDAAQPLSILPSNWDQVATGSTVSWTQAVTFPNIAP